MANDHTVANRFYRYITSRGGFPSTFQPISLITVVSTYVLMVLGAYTSAIGAGLSCPDWPTCYGSVVPFFHPEIVSNSPYSALQIFAEWAHRGLAMIVGFMILGTVIAAWKTKQRKFVVWSSTLALLLLPLQVGLGALTVTKQLQPFIVTSHLGVAILILVNLTVATVVPRVHK